MVVKYFPGELSIPVLHKIKIKLIIVPQFDKIIGIKLGNFKIIFKNRPYDSAGVSLAVEDFGIGKNELYHPSEKKIMGHFIDNKLRPGRKFPDF